MKTSCSRGEIPKDDGHPDDKDSFARNQCRRVIKRVISKENVYLARIANLYVVFHEALTPSSSSEQIFLLFGVGVIVLLCVFFKLKNGICRTKEYVYIYTGRKSSWVLEVMK